MNCARTGLWGLWADDRPELPGREYTLYVGNAIGAKSPHSFKIGSTLFRGISEASQNGTRPTSTNVLVGQAIE